MAVSDLEWALEQFRDHGRMARYQLGERYYLGDHNLNWAQQRFNDVFRSKFQAVAENLCPAVVDAVSDRLDVVGVESSAQRRREETVNGRTRVSVSDAPAARAWQLWEDSKMPLRSVEVHREALRTGDGYLIVWPTEIGGKLVPALWPQPAATMAVRYSETSPGVVELAAKLWHDQDGYLRLNLYYADRIERRQSRRPVKAGWATSDTLKANRFGALTGDRVGGAADEVAAREADVLPNPYGMPVFHFPNRRNHDYGLSELSDVIPLQDALNKSIADLLIAMEHSSYRQRWVTGLEVEINEETGLPKAPPWDHGADKMFATSSVDARFGDFAASDLSQFLEVQENFASKIARVTGTPLHYLFVTRGDFPSGEAMKAAEARFSNKLEDRMTSWGPTWADALAFAARIDRPADAGVRLQVKWKDVTPRTEQDVAQTLLMKKALGVPRSELLLELGYPHDKVDEMLAEPDESGETSVRVGRDGRVIATPVGREAI